MGDKVNISVILNISFRMLLFFILLPLGISCLNVIESPVKCASNNTACDVQGDGLIDSFAGVDGIAQCREICYADEDCGFITYYGKEGFPLRNFCEIFKACDTTLPCSKCVSETRGCYQLCSQNIIGVIADNFLDLIPNIGTEWDCRELCAEKSGCEYYTYYLETRAG